MKIEHKCHWCGNPNLAAESTLCKHCVESAVKFKVNLTAASRNAETNRLKGWKTTGRPES